MDAGARSEPDAASTADTGGEGPKAAADATNGEGSEPTTIADTCLVDVSESRLRVLKALHDQRCTASELARELDLNKSTVHGYLQDLVEDGFARRHEDEDRLWVYYSLTGAGEAIVDRDRLHLVVDLGTLTAFLASAGVGLYELFVADPGPSTSGTLGGPSVGSAGPEWTAIAYVGLLVLTVIGLAGRAYLRRRSIDTPEQAA